jgi:hypothetical protein
MPRERFDDPTTEGRFTQVSWRRQPGLDPDDQGSGPGYVQVSVHTPGNSAGEFADLDEAGIDRAIKTLHKAKRQAFGSQAVISSGMPGECSDVTPTANTASKGSLAALADEINHALRRT